MVMPLPPPRRVATLLIDNYDSYTFNIYQMLAQVNGLAPVVLRNDAFGGDWASAWRFFLSVVYGDERRSPSAAAATWPPSSEAPVACNVVLSPGPGHPGERADFGLCADAIRLAPVPVLGVCLGHQGLATAYGGRVVNAPEVMHGRTSRVELAPAAARAALFDHIPDGLEVVRYHSLAIDEAALPTRELRVLARSRGDGVVMAVQHRAKPQFGVQFHPEAVCSAFGFQLFQNLRDLTLGQPTSKCALEHASHPDSATGSIDSVASTSTTSSAREGDELSTYTVSVQRVRTGAASLALAEFVFNELFGSSERSFWLDSSNFDASTSTTESPSRFSIMGDDSGPLSYCVEHSVLDRSLRIHRANVDSSTLEDHDVLDHLREQLTAFRDHHVAFWEHDLRAGERSSEREASEIPFGFRGGFVGYFGYEVVGSGVHDDDPASSGVIKRVLEQRKRTGEHVPDASFIFADRALVFDHLEGDIYSLAVHPSKGDNGSSKWHVSTADRVLDLAKRFSRPMEGSIAKGTTHPSTTDDSVVFFPSRSREQYGHDIAQIQRLIHAGETYEVCLTNQLRASVELADPLGLYKLLRRRNPAPYAGFYLSNPSGAFTSHGREPSADLTPANAYAICCSSPERFLRVDRDGWMESKPIKGTRRRGRSASEDAAIAQELAACVKDRAENMMIADLVRNDFGVVAQIGSVHVPALMAVESYKTVHQLVTTVRGKKRPDADLVDILRATFPGGSMTGAPKKRTMRIIRQLERAPRGAYSGALGFLSVDGSCDLNIIIRTAVVTPRSVSLGAGGAIVAMSDTEDEYEEMLLKARALVQAVGCFVTGRDGDSGARVESTTVA